MKRLMTWFYTILFCALLSLPVNAALKGGAGGSGSVTDVSVAPANGVSGSVANSTTTPEITLTLGAITPSSVNVSGLTASQIVATDASKNLQTLTTGTYPSLTELSYVKGVTSAIQTQLTALASPWQTTSNVANLVTSTDNVTIGSATNLGKLAIDGDTNEVQLLVQGNAASQVANIMLVEQGGGTDLFTISNAGEVYSLGKITASQLDLGALALDLHQVGDIYATGVMTIRAEDKINISNVPGTKPITIGAATTSLTTSVIDMALPTYWRTGVNVGVGTTAPAATLFVDGSADQIQMQVQGHSTQTSNLAVFEKSDGTDYLTVAGAGNVGIGTSAPGATLDVVGNVQTTSTFTSSATGSLGWSVVNAANQACNTTCTSACVIGIDAVTTAFLNCTDATADSCLCAGGS